MNPGDHIIWHIPQPLGQPIIKTGQVRNINEFGAVVNQWLKDSRGVRLCVPEFYSWDELKRAQVVGNGAICE